MTIKRKENENKEKNNNNMEKTLDGGFLEMEELLQKSAKELPVPERNLTISKSMQQRKRNANLLQMFRRIAMITISVLLLGGGTAFASSATFRQAVIHFFTSGMKEEIPLEKLSSEPITVGDVTYLQKQKLDTHFQATYLSCSKYFEIVNTVSGNLLFYTEDEKDKRREYYQYVDGILTKAVSENLKTQGSIRLENLPGVMSLEGDTDYQNVSLPEMKFTISWQKIGDDIVLDTSGKESFDIGTAFGGSKDGKSIKGEYDGEFLVSAFPEDKEWVQVQFLYDIQSTKYQYPFLFHLSTKEIKNPLANVDLSSYPCITQLSICNNKKEATAYAGEDHKNLRKIWINLENGEVMESPVLESDTSFATSDTTFFYTTGTEENRNGYLYNIKTEKTTTLFQNVAWGYTWDYGFADTYVELIGGNFAALYKEVENQVYLLNLIDGSTYLLENIPASHDISFFWNKEYSVLSIEKNTEYGSSELAFYIPKLKKAWYFERNLSKSVQEVMSCWYGEYGYLIQAASEDYEQYYLYLYEYIE